MGTHSDGRNMCSGDMQSNGETMSKPITDKWRTTDITILGAFVVFVIFLTLKAFYTPGSIMYYGF